MAEEAELHQLRANADSLAACLHSLLQKIDRMEGEKEGTIDGPLTIATNSMETTHEFPLENGTKKIVTKKYVTSRSIHAVSLEASPTGGQSPSSPSPYSNLPPSRLVYIHARQLDQLSLGERSSRVIVLRVDKNANIDVASGDAIREVDGRVLISLQQLRSITGAVTLTVQPSALHEAPPVFYRLLSPHDSSSFSVRPGEIVQVMDIAVGEMHVRKVSDPSCVGTLPASVKREPLSLVSAYGRGVIALVGAPSVGRRTLKTLLLKHSPDSFATAVPVTSRECREGEQEGREYHFWRKEELLQRIRDKEMVEWGELDNQLYGTWAGHVAEVSDGGRVCVLDCSPQALPYLDNSIFRPFVVHIKPPEVEEAMQLENLRPRRRTPEQLAACSQAAQAIEDNYGSHIHLTLVNRNTDVTFKRLLSALEDLRMNPQFVPKKWNE